jgi:hypothetical protein
MKKIVTTLLPLILFLSFTSDLNAQSLKKQYEDDEVYKPELKPNYNQELKIIQYEDVVSEGIGDFDKDKLYDKLYRWVAINFNSANDVIQLSDKSTNNIIVKGRVKVVWHSPRKGLMKMAYNEEWYIPITLDLKTKDGRYKYELTISSYIKNVPKLDSYGEEQPIDNRLFNKYEHTNSFGSGDIYSKIDERIQTLLANIQLFVIQESIEEENEDW